MKIDGQCHCGAISFVGDVDAAVFNLCHCVECQVLTGTAFRANVNIAADRFVLRGKPKTYVKTAEQSGNKVRSAFCGSCGSPIYSCAVVESPPLFRVRLGIVRQRAQFAPRIQIWKGSAFHWVNSLADVPGFDGNPTT
jgi:hypothetical protein